MYVFKMYKLYIIIYIVILYTIFGEAQECEITEGTKIISTEKKLREHLLCNYNKHFIPFNTSEGTEINMSMVLSEYEITHYSGARKLHLSSKITVQWVDDNLVWNPNDYDSISELEMSTDEIWSPEIMPEEMQFFKQSSSILKSTECKVTSSGNVSCSVESYHYAFCNGDDRRWPYTEYTCETEYLILSYNGALLQINYPNVENGTLIIEKKDKDREWNIKEIGSGYYIGRAQLGLVAYEIFFEFTVERNIVSGRQFYFITIAVMAALSLMSFWSNFEATDRLILCLINIIYHIWEIQNMEWKFSRLGHTVPYILCFYRDSLIFAFILLIETMSFKKILTSDKQTPNLLIKLDRMLGKEIIRKILFVNGILTRDSKNEEVGSFEEELKIIKQSNQMEKKRIIQILDRIVFLGFIIAYFIMGTIIFTY